MAGNNIYMQSGSNYIDIHDNDIVNLNIDKASVNVQQGQTPSDDNLRAKAAILTENKEFMRILHKAVEQGFCTQQGWQYHWKVKVEAAYFASLASRKFKLSNRKLKGGKETAVSWIPFEALFGTTGLVSSFNDYKQCKTPLVNEDKLDKLFE